MGQICLSLFEDANENGLRDLDEPLLSGGTLSIEGLVSTSHITDGISEPFCFENLQPGDYRVAAGPPEGYHLTGLAGVPVTLSEGGAISLSFGAAPAPATAEAETATSIPVLRSTFLAVGIIGGVVLLATLGGIAVYVIALRKRAERAEGEQTSSSDS